MFFKTNYRLRQVKVYCRMLQGENSAIRLTFIKLPFVIKIFVCFVYFWVAVLQRYNLIQVIRFGTDHARIQKTPLRVVCVCVCVCVYVCRGGGSWQLSFYYTEGVYGLPLRRDPRGPIASRWRSVPGFLRDPMATCDFPGRVQNLCPPSVSANTDRILHLWIKMYVVNIWPEPTSSILRGTRILSFSNMSGCKIIIQIHYLFYEICYPQHLFNFNSQKWW